MGTTHSARQVVIFGLILFGLTLAAPAFAAEKPRLLVLTDIGGDPDDQQSLIRLLVHANEFDIEGLIASASGIPGELKAEVVKPELIRDTVTAYGKVQPNLVKHHPGFPTEKALWSASSPAIRNAASKASARARTRKGRTGSSRPRTATTAGR